MELLVLSKVVAEPDTGFPFYSYYMGDTLQVIDEQHRLILSHLFLLCFSLFTSAQQLLAEIDANPGGVEVLLYSDNHLLGPFLFTAGGDTSIKQWLLVRNPYLGSDTNISLIYQQTLTGHTHATYSLLQFDTNISYSSAFGS